MKGLETETPILFLFLIQSWKKINMVDLPNSDTKRSKVLQPDITSLI